MFFSRIPEISPNELRDSFTNVPNLLVLDVREKQEVALVKLTHPKVVFLPLSELAQKQTAALPSAISNDKDLPLVVICHHGSRSGSVTNWLIQQGWKNVKSLAGGVNAYAAEVDPSIGFY